LAKNATNLVASAAAAEREPTTKLHEKRILEVRNATTTTTMPRGFSSATKRYPTCPTTNNNHHGKSTSPANDSESGRVVGRLPNSLPIWYVDDKLEPFVFPTDGCVVGAKLRMLYG
jgi:hypothetical protein